MMFLYFLTIKIRFCFENFSCGLIITDQDVHLSAGTDPRFWATYLSKRIIKVVDSDMFSLKSVFDSFRDVFLYIYPKK